MLYFIRYACLVLSCLVLTVGAYIYRDHSLDSVPKIDISWVSKNNKLTKIGIIGDSWVSGNKLDLAVQAILKNYGINAEVVSSGHPGAKSRQILRDLFLGDSVPYSSQFIYKQGDLDYLIVLAGVNDTAGHIGAEFYAHHIMKIVEFCHAINVYPIIIEVPEYDILNVPPEGVMSFFKRYSYKLLFDAMQDDVIAKYRNALRSKLNSFGNNSYTLIEFNNFVHDYEDSMGLYANALHLNNVGYNKLGEYIGERLVSVVNINR